MVTFNCRLTVDRQFALECSLLATMFLDDISHAASEIQPSTDFLSCNFNKEQVEGGLIDRIQSDVLDARSNAERGEERMSGTNSLSTGQPHKSCDLDVPTLVKALAEVPEQQIHTNSPKDWAS